MDLSYYSDTGDSFLDLELRLIDELLKIDYGPKVEYIYNPLSYAFQLHKMYVEKYCSTHKKIIFLGMNPGPWGMMQNGVPFGEVNSVKEFMNISGCVLKPLKQHPSHPILGLNCKRTEISGKRFWALARSLSEGDVNRFFKNCFVHNYLPLAFLNDKGKNITPPEFKIDVQKHLQRICDESLCNVIRLFETEIVITIGRYAEKRVQAVLKQFRLQNIKVLYIPHPSPRNPESNKDWISTAKQILLETDLLKYFCS